MTRPEVVGFNPAGDNTRQQKVWAFAVAADGSASRKRLFAETTPTRDPGALSHPDGLKTDVEGNVFVAVVGTGVWVFDRNGRHLGIIPLPGRTTNVAFGDADARTLYITASTSLYRIRLANPGWDEGK